MKSILSIFLLVLFSTFYINFNVFQSYKLQFDLITEFNSKTLNRSTLTKFQKINTSIPNVIMTALPIAPLLAAYTHAFGESQDALEILNKNNLNNNEFENDLWRQRLLADHYMNQYLYDMALPIYQKLFQNPGFSKDANLINNLANIYLGTDATKALEFSKQSMAINNENPAIIDTMGWVYFKLGRYDESLQTLRNAYAMDSSNPTIRYHLANTLFKLNRKNEAKRELKFALDNAENERWQTDARELLATLE